MQEAKSFTLTPGKGALYSWGILILLALVWGSSFILMKRAMYTAEGEIVYSPGQVASLRIGIASLVMFPFMIGKWSLITGPHWKWLLAVGLFGNAIPAYLFTTAQTHISSSLAGMLNALTPLFTLAIALAVFKVRIRSWQIAGIFLGLAGAIIIILPGFAGGGVNGDLPYALLVVAATLCYAISLNIIKNKLTAVHPVDITAGALLYVGPVGMSYLLYQDFGKVVATTPGSGVGLVAAATLAIVGTAIALILFNYLVKSSSAIFASTVTYLIPVVAVVWGILDGETIASLQIAGGFVVLAGIFLINKKT